MKNENEQIEALQDIRKMMKESSRFLSLSGFSGILAGVFALTGSWIANTIISDYNSADSNAASHDPRDLALRIAPVAAGVLVLSILGAFIFSARKARKNNHPLFDHTSKKLLWNMFVPLAIGGAFCGALILHGGTQLLLVGPATLIFYGLALFSCSRLTLHDVKYLGYMQITLGLAACFFPAHSLFFWTVGFGVLHIIYGGIMWYKYDRN